MRKKIKILMGSIFILLSIGYLEVVRHQIPFDYYSNEDKDFLFSVESDEINKLAVIRQNEDSSFYKSVSFEWPKFKQKNIEIDLYFSNLKNYLLENCFIDVLFYGDEKNAFSIFRVDQAGYYYRKFNGSWINDITMCNLFEECGYFNRNEVVSLTIRVVNGYQNFYVNKELIHTQELRNNFINTFSIRTSLTFGGIELEKSTSYTLNIPAKVLKRYRHIYVLSLIFLIVCTLILFIQILKD